MVNVHQSMLSGKFSAMAAVVYRTLSIHSPHEQPSIKYDSSIILQEIQNNSDGNIDLNIARRPS